MNKDKYENLLAHARSISRDKGIDMTLMKYDIDVLIAPADSPFNLLVSAAGKFSSPDVTYRADSHRLSFCDHASFLSRVQWKTYRPCGIHKSAWREYFTQAFECLGEELS